MKKKKKVMKMKKLFAGLLATSIVAAGTSAFAAVPVGNIVETKDTETVSDCYCIDLGLKENKIIINGALEDITTTQWCTRCHSNSLWSHRKNGNDRGSLAAFLCLK